LKQYFLGFDEVISLLEVCPGHISGPRSGGKGLHLAATAAARPWSLAASGGAEAEFELCAVRFGNAL